MLLETESRKSYFQQFLLWSIKWTSGFFISFVLAVFGMSVLSYGALSFVFVFTAVQIFFWRWFHKSSVISVLLFDAAVIFSLLMFRLYVVLGPNL